MVIRKGNAVFLVKFKKSFCPLLRRAKKDKELKYQGNYEKIYVFALPRETKLYPIVYIEGIENTFHMVSSTPNT